MKNRLIIGFVVAFVLISAQAGPFSKDVPASTWESNSQVNSQVTLEPDTQVDSASTSTPALVTRVVDGDTIVVLVNGVSEKVRLIGVDTPETVAPRRTVECFGKEASAFTTSILHNKNVVLEPDETQNDRDKYGRLLRYVFLDDETLANKEIISNGYGHEYTYLLPYKYQAEFVDAELSAQKAQRGLWAQGACN